MEFFLALSDFISNDILASQYFGITLMQYIFFFATLFVAIFIGKVVSFVFNNYGQKLADKTANKFDDIIISIIGSTIIFFFFLAGLLFAYQFLSITDPFINSVVNQIFSTILLVLIAWILIRLIDELTEEFIMPLVSKSHTDLDDQLIPLLRKVAKIMVIALFGVVILSSFGYDVTAIIAGLGIGGLALAFAAKETISDIFGGVSIFTSKPFKVGEKILFNGEFLTVVEIGLRYTRLKNLEDRLVIVPNSQIASAVVTNVTYAPKKKIRAHIGVTYDTSPAKLEKAKELIKKAVESTKGCEKDPSIYFREFKDSALDLFAIYYITDMDNWLKINDEVNTKVKTSFDKAKIEFAFPTQTVYVKK